MMMLSNLISLLNILLLVVCLSACGNGGKDGNSESTDTHLIPFEPQADTFDPTEYLSAGETTVARSERETFSRSMANLSLTQQNTFALGDADFERVQSSGQLGPLFNASSCQGCHLKDGRGNPPPNTTVPMISMFMRVSIGRDEENGAIPDPIYGTQLQTFGIDQSVSANGLAINDGALIGAGAIGEAFAFIEYETVSGFYTDGTSYELRKPVYKIRDVAYGVFADNVTFSPRVAPGMIGLGLLEAIAESDILAKADPDDVDQDGISGRPNYGFSVINQQLELGRFGWKASTPSVLQQSAGAYRGDMGVTNSLLTEEPCTAMQAACVSQAANEDKVKSDVDLRDTTLAAVEFYSKMLAVNQRDGFDRSSQTWDDTVWRGRNLFFNAGCAGCHTPKFRTSTAAGSVLGDLSGFSLQQPAADIAELSQQIIWPFTDLLLHDMGGQCADVAREDANGDSCSSGAGCYWVLRCEGLADGRDDFLATGREWRTAPLWNLGLVQTVNPQAGFLHDGRARNIEEAVLWHGSPNNSLPVSEAQRSWQTYINMSAQQRSDLLRFLESL